MICSQPTPDDSYIMNPKSLSVKDNLAVSAQNLATSAFLTLSRADANTSLAIRGTPAVLGCVPHLEKMLYDNAQLAHARCASTPGN